MADTTEEKKKVPRDKKTKIRKVQRELHKREIHDKRVEVSQLRRQEDRNSDGNLRSKLY